MTPIGLAGRSCKYIPVHNPTDVCRLTVALLFGIKAIGMLFVEWLSVECGLGGCEPMVGGDLYIARAGAVTCLVHVEGQPIRLMIPVGAASGLSRLGVKGDQDGVHWILASQDSHGHLVPDFDIGSVFPWSPVAANDPNQVFAISVSRADPFAVGKGGLRI